MSLTETVATVASGEALNTSFSRIVPKLQLAWDSTSFDALDKCPRLYQYSIIEGYGLSGTNPHLKWGTIFHSATELYDKRRAAGDDHEQALTHALRHAVLETWDPELKRPWSSDEPTKTRNTLLRSLVWYLDFFQNDSLETLILANGKAAVELSFRFALTDLGTDVDFRAPTGEEYLLCGHIDKIVRMNNEIRITDKKSTKYALDDNYFRQYTPNNQVSVYTIAGIIILSQEIDGLIIDGIQVLVEGTRFRRRAIPHSHEQLEEWLSDFRIKLRQAEEYALNNYWPMNRKSCGFGRAQCQFRPVCSAEPSMREDILNSMYPKRQWDPLQPR